MSVRITPGWTLVDGDPGFRETQRKDLGEHGDRRLRGAVFEPRSVQPPSAGNLVAFPQVDGLHHRYERRAA